MVSRTSQEEYEEKQKRMRKSHSAALNRNMGRRDFWFCGLSFFFLYGFRFCNKSLVFLVSKAVQCGLTYFGLCHGFGQFGSLVHTGFSECIFLFFVSGFLSGTVPLNSVIFQ